MSDQVSTSTPLYIEISPGQAHDITRAESLLQRAREKAFIGDRAYHSKSLFQAVKERNMKFVVPSKSNHSKKRRHDAFLYAKRINVGWFFHNLKKFRDIATRYRKNCGVLHFCCSDRVLLSWQIRDAPWFKFSQSNRTIICCARESRWGVFYIVPMNLAVATRCREFFTGIHTFARNESLISNPL